MAKKALVAYFSASGVTAANTGEAELRAWAEKN